MCTIGALKTVRLWRTKEWALAVLQPQLNPRFLLLTCSDKNLDNSDTTTYIRRKPMEHCLRCHHGTRKMALLTVEQPWLAARWMYPHVTHEWIIDVIVIVAAASITAMITSRKQNRSMALAAHTINLFRIPLIAQLLQNQMSIIVEWAFESRLMKLFSIGIFATESDGTGIKWLRTHLLRIASQIERIERRSPANVNGLNSIQASKTSSHDARYLCNTLIWLTMSKHSIMAGTCFSADNRDFSALLNVIASTSLWIIQARYIVEPARLTRFEKRSSSQKCPRPNDWWKELLKRTKKKKRQTFWVAQRTRRRDIVIPEIQPAPKDTHVFNAFFHVI